MPEWGWPWKRISLTSFRQHARYHQLPSDDVPRVRAGARGWNHAQRRFGGGKREWGYWCAEDPESRYLPVTYVNRDFEGLVDVIVGQLEIETEKEPLSAMLRKARAAR